MPTQEADGVKERDALNAAFALHHEQTQRALADGQPQRIKDLYKDFGAALAEAVGEGEAPVLAFPETAPVVARLLAGTDGTILDAGCGPFPVASLATAADDDRTVIGVDIGHGMVDLARRQAAQAGVRFLGVVADVERLPFRDGTFGAVLCDDTIEHVPDDHAAAAELARVASPSGPVVVATPNRNRLDVLWSRFKDLLRGDRQPVSSYFAAKSHLREYTWRELKEVLEPRLTVTTRAPVPWSGGAIKRLANRLTSSGPGYAWTRVLVAVARPQPEVQMDRARGRAFRATH